MQPTMDSLVNSGGCQMGGGGGGGGGRLNGNAGPDSSQNGQSMQAPSGDIRHAYTIPGIVQFLQYEWQRFEMSRQQWQVEKNELQARIMMLQGERSGQENVKYDLIRRIKMLEYCLQQERAKYHKLKFGTDPPNYTNAGDDLTELNQELEENLNSESQSPRSVSQGRQLLRQYLQEIGYTDTIIDVRSNRVRSFLGLSNLDSEQSNDIDKMQNSVQLKKKKDLSNPNAMLLKDAESNVLATFEFLHEQNNDNGLESMEEEEMIDSTDTGALGGDDETEEVMNEFDMMLNNRVDVNETELANWKANVSKDVDIGELATLTDTNDVIETGNNTVATELRKTWNQKYVLKSHYEGIRTLRFHQTEPLLITASHDETIKLWNLNKTQPVKYNSKNQNLNAGADLEPNYTYRGHLAPVISLCVNDNVFYSGDATGKIMSWQFPNLNSTSFNDQYVPFDSSLQSKTVLEHENAVWSLGMLSSATSSSQILCSASADGSIKIWDLAKSVATQTIQNGVVPTDLLVVGSPNLNSSVSSSSLLISSHTDGSICLYDIENSSAPVLTFDASNSFISSISMHPTMPMVISAHHDRKIRIWDMNTGKCIDSMVAHLDEVTSIDCDPNGLYFLSGSHDCSVRLWNFDSRNCVQEITAHRKKFQESIFDVKFHPTKPYFASAGADSLAKVFV